MKKKFTPILLTLSCLFLLCGSTYLLLPFLVTSFLIPHFLENLPVSTKVIKLNHLTPSNISGHAYLADKNRPIITIPRFDLHYTFTNLLQGQLKSLVIEGASLEAAYENGRLTFNENIFREKENAAKEPKKLLFPITLQTLVLKNCSLVIRTSSDEKAHLILDVELQIDMRTTEKGYLLKSIEGKAILGGLTPLRLNFSVNDVTNGYTLSIEGKAPSISSLIHPFIKLDELQGTMDFKIQSFLKNHPLQLGDFSINVTLADFLLRHRQFTLENNPSQYPVAVHIKGNHQSAEYSIMGLHSFRPLMASTQLQGNITRNSQDILTTGEMQVTLQSSKDDKITLSPPFIGSFSVELSSAPQHFLGKIKLHGDGDRPLDIDFGGITLLSEPLHLSVKGGKKNGKSNISFALDGKKLQFEKEDFSLHLPNLIFSGTLNKSEEKADATLTAHLPEISLPQKKITLRDISFLFPFHHPLSKDLANKGTINIKEIHALDTNLGSLKANTQLTQEELLFTGTVDSHHIQPMQLQFSGRIDPHLNLEASCTLPPTSFSSLLFPSSLPIPESLVLEGELALEGDFSLQKKRPQGSLSGRFSQGILTMEEKDLSISGIKLEINLPELPKLTSDPSQVMTIDAIDFGSFHITDGRVRYRLEDPKSLFIEKSRFTWCGGKIESGSLRLSTKHPEIETTLYCDRLSFSELLTQFSVTDTEGEGSLNGKLPIHFSKSGLDVDGGFLFSTPGKSGIIKFNNTAMLRDSMPAVDKTGYLDYSLQALENFSYDWTKLSFSNREDDLLLAMEIDGKPVSPLPFQYKQGQITPSNKGPGMQHPVHLDVNFRLPLKDMFRYGHNIQSIMENM